MVGEDEIKDCEYYPLEDVINYTLNGKLSSINCIEIEEALEAKDIDIKKLYYWQEYNPAAYVAAYINDELEECCEMYIQSRNQINTSIREQMSENGATGMDIRNVISDMNREY